MSNVVDYVSREFRAFSDLPFGPVDSLVLSELSYMHMPVAVPRFGARRQGVRMVALDRLMHAEDYPSMFANNSERSAAYRLALFRAVCESPRFRGIRVGECREVLDADRQQQFAAMTFDLSRCGGMSKTGKDGTGSGWLYVAFRGTDDTLVGWKEDLNMAFRSPVPSQQAAVDYLRSVMVRSAREPSQAVGGACGQFPAPNVMVGGHSKGGNMAVYAAMRMAESGKDDCIVRVFSHDGPGFPPEVVNGDAYAAIAPRISKTVPEFSVVGMLLDGTPDYAVVRSDAVNVLQHIGRTWQVAEDGGFETGDGLDPTAVALGRVIDGWLDAVPPERRELFIDQMYGVFAAAGYDRLPDLVAHWAEALPRIMAAVKGMDRSTRSLMLDAFGALPASAVRLIGRDA